MIKRFFSVIIGLAIGFSIAFICFNLFPSPSLTPLSEEEPSTTTDNEERDNEEGSLYGKELFQLIASWSSLVAPYESIGLSFPEGTQECRFQLYNVIIDDTSLYQLALSQNCYNDEGTYGGIFVSPGEEEQWEPWIQIMDVRDELLTEYNQYSNRNRPQALTLQNQKLWLSVVDTNGGGSMEGIESVLELQFDGTWETIRCYNYDNRGMFENEARASNEEGSNWYANGTVQFNRLHEIPLEECKDNVKVMYY